MNMVRIHCDCNICNANAQKIGKAFPLAALVPCRLAAAVKGQTHGLVYDAHNPDAMGAAIRRATGIIPA